MTCGDDRRERRRLLERLAVPAGAGRRRRRQSRRAADPRAARGLSRPCSPSSRACAPTRRRTASTSRTCSATSARSPATSSTQAEAGRRPLGQRRLGRSAGPASRRSTTAWLRGMPGYQQVAVDSMGRVLGDDGEVAGQPGDTLVTSIDAQGAGRRRAAARRRRSSTARATYDTVTAPQLRRRLRRRRRAGGQDRPGRRDGQPADVRPRGLGRRHHQEAARAALLRARPAPRCSAAPPRASSRPARRGSRS